MKECFKCGQKKELSEFYKHKQMKDGRLNKCKECTKSDVSSNYASNIDHYKEYDKNRAMLPHRVEARRLYAKTENGRASKTRATKNYRRDNPRKYKAHRMVGNAIRDGKLFREPCEVCGTTEKIHAHHDDYSKPLNIRFLCSAHHSQWHRDNGEGLNP